MTEHNAAFTVRLSPDAHERFERCGSMGKGIAARLVMELFTERLRANGGDYLEALMSMRDALGHCPSTAADTKEST